MNTYSKDEYFSPCSLNKNNLEKLVEIVSNGFSTPVEISIPIEGGRKLFQTIDELANNRDVDDIIGELSMSIHQGDRIVYIDFGDFSMTTVRISSTWEDQDWVRGRYHQIEDFLRQKTIRPNPVTKILNSDIIQSLAIGVFIIILIRISILLPVYVAYSAAGLFVYILMKYISNSYSRSIRSTSKIILRPVKTKFSFIKQNFGNIIAVVSFLLAIISTIFTIIGPIR